MSGGKSAAAPRRRQDQPRRRRARRLRSQPSHWLRSLRAPAAVPGIGPKTATALVTSPGILMLRDHDELTSHCSVAPTDSRSSTSIRSTSPQRGDDNPLKNLLMLSRPPYRNGQQVRKALRRVRDGGMRCNEALKAIARKRLKDIYAIMRDAVPSAAQVATCEDNLVGKECGVRPDAPCLESEGH